MAVASGGGETRQTTGRERVAWEIELALRAPANRTWETGV